MKTKIETIFDEDNLKKIKYNLHSVCIHEGNATSGHFWTYIWNKQQSKWHKFNDTEVCESNWEDLYENAVGGNYSTNSTTTATSSCSNKASNDSLDFTKKTESLIKSNLSNEKMPSAYFLIYVKDDDPTLYQGQLAKQNQLKNFQLNIFNFLFLISEANHFDVDLIKLINDDQEMLDNQLHNLKLKSLLRETLEKLRKSNFLINETLDKGSNSDDFN